MCELPTTTTRSRKKKCAGLTTRTEVRQREILAVAGPCRRFTVNHEWPCQWSPSSVGTRAPPTPHDWRDQQELVIKTV